MNILYDLQARIARLEKMSKEKYPWDKCIEDQMEQYGDRETAEKVCGKIKAQSQGKKAAWEHDPVAENVAYQQELKVLESLLKDLRLVDKGASQVQFKWEALTDRVEEWSLNTNQPTKLGEYYSSCGHIHEVQDNVEEVRSILVALGSYIKAEIKRNNKLIRRR